jgi:hypothetical protein
LTLFSYASLPREVEVEVEVEARADAALISPSETQLAISAQSPEMERHPDD